MERMVVLARTRKTVLLLASVAAAVLLACGIVLTGAAGSAEAAVPAQNGKILFRSYPSDSSRDLQTMNPDGSGRTSFSPPISGDTPEWSPDGTKFAYVPDIFSDEAHAGGIVISSADGTQKTPVPNTTGFPPEVRSVTWSPDGTKLAFAVDKYVDVIDPFTGEPVTVYSSDIYTIKVDGSNLTNLRKDVPPEHAAYSDPEWSPDGTMIAFSHEDIFATGVVREIYTVKADGTGQPTGFADPVRGRHPDWSPDGSEIAFVGPDDDLHVMNADGTGRRQITTDGGEPPFGSVEPMEAVIEKDPEWSPDGTKLAFAGWTYSCNGMNCTGTDYDIFTVGIDGSEKRNLTNTPGNIEYSPSWQPVFASPDTTAPRVDSVIPANGKTSVARNTNLKATFSEPMDPATIGTATFRLFKVNPDGTTTRITNAPVSLSADGLSATLNPYGATSTTRLAPNSRYKGVVTTGAEDVAGNALDQNPATAGNQQKVWYFTTRGG